MRLGTIEMLREALGGRKPNGDLVVGRTYASALKKAAGVTGVRLFDIDAVVEWRKAHPTWKTTDVFARSLRKASQPKAQGGKENAP